MKISKHFGNWLFHLSVSDMSMPFLPRWKCLPLKAGFCSTIHSLWKLNILPKRRVELCYLCRIYWGNIPLRSSVFIHSFLNAHLEQRVWPLQPGRTQWSNWTKAAPEMYAGEQWTRGQKQSIWCLGKKAHTQILIKVSPDSGHDQQYG